MDVLVLGGSVFLGRAVVGEALAAGHTVTVFNRGVSGPQPDGVTHVRGDRTSAADLARLADRTFDLVVDTSGYVPADVAMSANLLAGRCHHYAFVSSINVFPDWPVRADYHARGVYDGDPDATRDDVPAELTEAGPYGWLKVGCERAVQRAFGEHCAVLRAGLLAGPDDSAVGRLPWVIDRVARGGEVLWPGGPDDPVSLIDARDLARFVLSGAQGVFETGGPRDRDTRADLFAACVAATGSDAVPTFVDGEWLAAQDVQAWTELPLWIPKSEGLGAFAHDNSAAETAGLRWRPLVDTVADTWAWQQSIPDGWRPTAMTPGLASAKELELLGRWHARA